MSTLVVRAELDPSSMARTIRTAIREFEPDQPLADIKTMQQVVHDSIARPRFYTLLLAIFAALAAILAFAGIYAVTSYLVSQQQHEIGIRMAIGARRGHIIREFAGHGWKCILIGIGCGLATAFAATRLMSSLLFEVGQNDPATYACMSILLLVLTLSAVLVPTRRAAHVDPAVALRHD
jgi:ABC-type antimicrobial peptide transport system permease subunit